MSAACGFLCTQSSYNTYDEIDDTWSIEDKFFVKLVVLVAVVVAVAVAVVVVIEAC